jgi:hypothetical protein
MANQLDFRVKNGLIVGGNADIGGAITSVDSIQLDTALPYVEPGNGKIVWNETESSLEIGLGNGVVASLPEVTLYHVTNNTGSTIPKGTLVAAAGTVGNSGKILVAPYLASAHSPVQIMGITTESIATGLDGHVTHFGKVRGIQTNGANVGEIWSNGDILYARAAGGLTKTLPAAPATKTIIAIVISAHPANGTLFVRPTLSSSIANDDLVQLGTLANNDFLVYNSTAGRFENKTRQATTNIVAGAVTAGQFLRGDGTNVVMSAIQASDVPTLNQNTTGSAAVGTAVTLTATNTTNASHFLTFTDAATGNQNLRTDTDLTYNPSTNTLSVGAAVLSGALRVDGNTTLGDASTDTVAVNGYMGVGGAGASNIGFRAINSALTGNSQYGIVSAPVATSAATTLLRGFASFPTTVNAAFTTSEVSAFYAAGTTKGASNTITNLHGVQIADQTQGTNNFGITSLVSSGTNKWNVYASGTAANYFAGNVGIGTTSPGQELHVQSTAGTEANVRLSGNAGASSYMDVFHNSVEAGLWNAGNTPMRFATNNAERMRISADGSVGIGTSSPNASARLHVVGLRTFLDSGDEFTLRIGTTANGAGGYIGSTAVNVLNFYNGSGTERMRINSVGNVGIANTNPQARLQVEELGIDTTTTSFTIGNAAGTVYSVGTTLFRTMELMIQITQGSNYHAVKLFVLHNGTDVWFNQTNVLHTAAELGTFSMDISSGNVRAIYTPTSTAVASTVKVAATMIAV